MKRRDLLRHPSSRGCTLLRKGGSHSWWQNLSLNRLSAVPRHSEVNDYSHAASNALIKRSAQRSKLYCMVHNIEKLAHYGYAQ